MSNPLTLGQCSGAGASSSRPLLRSPQRSTSTLSKPRGLQSSSKRVISLCLSRNCQVSYLPTHGIDSNAITIGARHPNSEVRINITHRLVDNPTSSSPYKPRPSRPTGFPFLSIFSPYSRRDPRWFPSYHLFYFNFRRFADFLKVLDIISIVTIDCGPLSPLAPDILYP